MWCCLRQPNLLIIQVMEGPTSLLILLGCVANQWDKGKLMPPLSAAADHRLVDKLDSGPDSNGGEGVEYLLDPLVELPNVLDLQPGFGDLQGPGQVRMAQAGQSLVLEVELFDWHLQGLKVGCLSAQRYRSQVLYAIADWLGLLLQMRLFDRRS